MNSENKSCCSCTAKVAYAIAVIGAILIVVFLDRQLKKYTAAPAVDAGRAEERAKDLAEIHNAEAEALNNTGWIDQSKGVVRLKIDDAMQLMEEIWKNPAAGRSNLLERVEKAYPPPPPPAPAKPSLYE
ncbi:MAG TPA: hypothetical protein VN761_13415 [Candidatus Polarisedimenticolia bacterium]|nr:hypothetical protein [Candidatus Polarisedimenticolia bacterium]